MSDLKNKFLILTAFIIIVFLIVFCYLDLSSDISATIKTTPVVIDPSVGDSEEIIQKLEAELNALSSTLAAEVIEFSDSIDSLNNDFALLGMRLDRIEDTGKDVLTIMKSSSVADEISQGISRIEDKMDKTESFMQNGITVLNNKLEALSSSFANHNSEISSFEGHIISEFKKIEEANRNITTKGEMLDKEINKILSVVTSEELDQKISDVTSKIEDVFSIVNGDKAGEIAEKSFSLAENISMDNESRDVFYLNAIYHDPTNIDYFISYIDFLDSTGAPDEKYWALSQTVYASMLQFDSSVVEDLLPIYVSVVNSYASSDTIEDEEEQESYVDPKKTWQDAVDMFSSYPASESFSFDELSFIYDIVKESFYSLTTAGVEESDMMSNIDNIYNLYASYESIKDAEVAYSVLDDFDFIVSFNSFNSFLEATKFALLTRNRSNDLTYAALLDNAMSEINDIQQRMLLRNDDIIYKELELVLNELRSTSATITEYNKEQILSRYSKVKVQYSESLASLLSMKADEYISSLNDLMTDITKNIYEYQFTQYQLWASEVISNAYKAVDAAKKGDKLKELYKSDFFEIIPSNLIPQLKDAYDSIYKHYEDYKDDSTTSEASLIRRYSIVRRDIGGV